MSGEQRPLSGQLAAIMRSDGWRMVERELRDRIRNETAKLIHGGVDEEGHQEPNDLEHVSIRRGWVQALEWVLEEMLPALTADVKCMEQIAEGRPDE